MIKISDKTCQKIGFYRKLFPVGIFNLSHTLTTDTFQSFYFRPSQKSMKIVIIGAGNVATQLALGLKKAGHEIVQIFNRSGGAGKELAKTVGASFTSNAGELKEADVYLLAVKDDVISQVAGQLALGNKTVAHTSGSKSRDLLAVSSSNYGVFYPLQTMTKLSRVDFKNVPVLVEANNEKTLNQLAELANTISGNVHRVTDDQRRWIHVAAVFANNFTNHLWALSEELLREHGISFDLLKPLIQQSIRSLDELSPSKIQTGPAARGDHQLVQAHLMLLAENPKLHKLYRVLTESIIKTNAGQGAAK